MDIGRSERADAPGEQRAHDGGQRGGQRQQPSARQHHVQPEPSQRPGPRDRSGSICVRARSIIRPNGTWEGHTSSHARQTRHRSMNEPKVSSTTAVPSSPHASPRSSPSAMPTPRRSAGRSDSAAGTGRTRRRSQVGRVRGRRPVASSLASRTRDRRIAYRPACRCRGVRGVRFRRVSSVSMVAQRVARQVRSRPSRDPAPARPRGRMRA